MRNWISATWSPVSQSQNLGDSTRLPALRLWCMYSHCRLYCRPEAAVTTFRQSSAHQLPVSTRAIILSFMQTRSADLLSSEMCITVSLIAAKCKRSRMDGRNLHTWSSRLSPRFSFRFLLEFSFVLAIILPSTMVSYCRHNVVCLSVRLSVMKCIVTKRCIL